MGAKQSRQSKGKSTAEFIYEKYGEKGIKDILAQGNSDYQSYSYVKIQQGCQDRVDKLERQGEDLIYQYRKLSEEDYRQVERDLEEKYPGAIKKAEQTQKTDFREIIGFDKQLERYDKLKINMKKAFDDERVDLQDQIYKEVVRNQRFDLRKKYPQYHDNSEDEKAEILRDIENMYGKELYLREENQMERGRKSVGKDHQFNFSQKWKPKFQRLIPKLECEKTRQTIKKNLSTAAKDLAGQKSKICSCCGCCDCCCC